MKKVLASLVILTTLIFTGCGNSGTDTTETPVPDGMIAYDLTEYGMDALVNIPDSTRGPSNHENVGDGVMLRVGNDFAMKVKVGAGEMDYVKNELIAKSEVYKLEKYLLEQPDAIIWRQFIEGQDTSTRFFAVVKVGDVTYEVESDPDTKFGEAQCKEMLDAAKSLRAKPAPKAAE